ncbi:MAG TPA: hypothetical protein VHQ23_18440 [Ilumatobacteraceae bacterium]|nr:hypothetical protein [Ilumatobacteraceae bacterium]
MARRPSPVGIVVVAVFAVVAIAVVVRRVYFSGRLLEPDELTGEQQYRRCRRRLR